MARTITVKGIGAVSAKPDYVIIQLSLLNKELAYADAVEQGNRRINRLQDALGQVGFSKDALKTTGYHVDINYRRVEHVNSYSKEFDGYACSHTLKLAFAFSSEKLNDALTAISDSNAKPELDIRFTVKEPNKISEELLADAAVNARRKAEVLCQASDVKLGQLVSINYNWGELDIYSETRYDMGNACLPMATRGGPDITPDDIDLEDQATFVWEIQ